jgi:hypothetical protein
MTPKKPDWFEITEGGDAYAGIQKVNKKLPIVTLIVAGAVILGGSIFANANNEPSANADTPTASQSIAAAQPSASASTPTGNPSTTNSLPVPTVTNVPQRGDRDGDHEGRERGEGHERGDGDRFEHDDD